MTRFGLCAAVLVCLSNLAFAEGPNGEWFILAGNGGCWTSDINHPAAKRLIERGRKGCPLNCVAITPNDEWVTLVGGNEFYNSDDLHVSRKLAELWKNPNVKEYKCVAFTPQGGWVALVDSNTYYAEQIPEDAEKKLAELAKAGVEIRSIAFTPQGGWVILEGESGVWHHGIPESAAKKLDELVGEKTRVLCTAFSYQNDWIILTASNGVWTNDVDLPVARVLSKLQRRHIPLKWVAFSPGEYPGDYMIVRRPTDRVKATLTMSITDPSEKVAEWYVYGPKAPNFPGQDEMKTTLSHNAKVVKEFSPLKRELLLARIVGAPKQVTPTLSVEGTLYSRKLCPRPAGVAAVPDLSAEDFKNYTRSSASVDFNTKPFQFWLDHANLRRDITFARRAYLFIRHNFVYEFPGGDGRATLVAERGTSDCGGLSCVMIAALRANGIPARMLLGRWAQSDAPPDKITGEAYGQWHVKAEFFAKGVGWIPLDVAAAVTDKDRGEFAHFGNDPGDFIALCMDQDIEVDTFVKGRFSGFGLQGIWWWRKGGDDVRIKETWAVSKQPAKKK